MPPYSSRDIYTYLEYEYARYVLTQTRVWSYYHIIIIIPWVCMTVSPGRYTHAISEIWSLLLLVHYTSFYITINTLIYIYCGFTACVCSRFEAPSLSAIADFSNFTAFAAQFEVRCGERTSTSLNIASAQSQLHRPESVVPRSRSQTLFGRQN